MLRRQGRPAAVGARKASAVSRATRVLVLFRPLPLTTAIILLLVLVTRLGWELWPGPAPGQAGAMGWAAATARDHVGATRQQPSRPIEPAAGPPALAAGSPSSAGAGAAEERARAMPVSVVPAETGAVQGMVAELARQRASLEERERALAQREAALSETEVRIRSELARLQQLKEETQRELQAAAAADADRMKQLGDIYAAMKPKRAATIFDQMPMEHRLAVAKVLRGSKLAAIMAEMNPDQARALSTALAKEPAPDTSH